MQRIALDGLEAPFDQLAHLLGEADAVRGGELAHLVDRLVIDADGEPAHRRRRSARGDSPLPHAVRLGSTDAVGLGSTDVGAARGKCGSSDVGENATSAPTMMDQESQPESGGGDRSVAAIESGAGMAIDDRSSAVAQLKTASRDAPAILTSGNISRIAQAGSAA